MKTLTISIAAYNAAKTLEKCVDSLVNSEYIDDLEIIIVNDGSVDNTFEIAAKYAQKYPKSVIVIDKENGGHGSTINSSILRSTGKYYKIVDADDWVETKNLDKLINRLKTIDDDLIINPYYIVDYITDKKSVGLSFDKSSRFDHSFTLDEYSPDSTSLLHMHAMTVKTSVVKAIGPVIDEHCFYVDAEFVAYVYSKADTFRLLDYYIYDYLLGNTNQSVDKTNMIMRRKQHETVIMSVLSYFPDIMYVYTEKNVCINNHIVGLIKIQYKLLLLLPSDISKKEYIEFDQQLPNIVYSKLGRKMKSLLFALKLYNYAFYNPLHRLLNSLGIVDKKL